MTPSSRRRRHGRRDDIVARLGWAWMLLAIVGLLVIRWLTG